jgi:hypothetical protein
MTRWIGVVSVTFLTGLLAGALAHRAFSAGEPGLATEPRLTVPTPTDPGTVRPTEVTPPAAEPPGSAPWVAEIVARLDRAATEHHRLEQEVAALHEKVRELEARITHVASEDTPDAVPGEGVAGARAEGQEAVDPSLPLETRLAALGLDQDRAAEIAQRVSARDLDRLYLRDQAIREGWFNTPRYGQALREVDGDLNALREEVGDDAYDRYLYATGEANRVVVGSVIADSAAQEAGLKAGDTVLQYDDRRVFSTTELQSATAEGVAEELVTVTVLRGDQRLRLYVPRGPLGIRLLTERRHPDAAP